MIVLGAYLKIKPYVVQVQAIIEALRKSLPKRHHHLIPDNENAYHVEWRL